LPHFFQDQGFHIQNKKLVPAIAISGWKVWWGSEASGGFGRIAQVELTSKTETATN
jgi:hypothetical protein